MVWHKVVELILKQDRYCCASGAYLTSGNPAVILYASTGGERRSYTLHPSVFKIMESLKTDMLISELRQQIQCLGNITFASIWNSVCSEQEKIDITNWRV